MEYTVKHDVAFGDGSHHHSVYISDKSQDNFIKEILENQVKTKNIDNISSIVSYIKSNTIYVEKNGLYMERHLGIGRPDENGNIIVTPFPHIGTFCHVVYFFNSSPDWWKNIQIISEKYNIFYFLEAIEYFKQRVGVSLAGSSELRPDYYYMAKNIALSTEGWDFNDPPLEFIIFGDKEKLPVPRFSVVDTKGLIVGLSSKDGAVKTANVVDGGNNYDINDEVDVYFVGSEGAKLRVAEVENGSVTKLTIINEGKNYPLFCTAITGLYNFESNIRGQYFFPQHEALFE
ncbi:hypothetical protein EBS67_00090 [bacterium]|nr:hypothetical protein [bacterium]NBT60658.1 hypothetical protein [Planctomycetia bacterium]